MADEKPENPTLRELTLDQLSRIQPGVNRLMPEISERFWILTMQLRVAIGLWLITN